MGYGVRNRACWIILLSILAGGQSFAPASVLAPARCSRHCRLFDHLQRRGRRGREEAAARVVSRGRTGGILQGLRCVMDGARRVRQKTSKKAAEFSSNNGLIYLRSFLPKQVFSEVSRECSRTKGKLSPERSSFASGRKGAYMPKDGATSLALMSDDVAERIREVTGETARLVPSDYPVEMRTYPIGSMMEWHADELLYDVPQYELVFTVLNTGDSVTQWRDKSGRIIEQATEPNSLLVIKAGAAEHRVTPIKRGERHIVKAVYCCKGAAKLPAFEETMQY